MSRIIVFLAAVLLAPACRSHVPAGVLVGSGDESGRFVAHYGAASPVFRDFRSGLVANRFLDTISMRLNGSLRIPRDIVLETAHCGEPNAKYDPDRRRVTLCYELFQSLSDRFTNTSGGEYLVTGTVMFALMHELGHALVDVLQLPITGKEEDAVDQLATILLLQQGTPGDSLAFGAVGWFVTNARMGVPDDLAFADDHGLDRQRVYNIVCWIYARDPERYPEIVTGGWLPEHRREGCPSEFRRLVDSWRRILAPFRRFAIDTVQQSRGDL
jgi:hypothetical protein